MPKTYEVSPRLPKPNKKGLNNPVSDFALVIMAAGIGSRFGGLKQIAPVGPNGENTIEYSIFDGLRAGFNKVIFVINQNIEEEFRQEVGRKIEGQCETVYVLQRLNDLPPGVKLPQNRLKPWGTGQAVLSCKDAIKGPFAVINADDYYGETAYRTMFCYLQNLSDVSNHYCMMGYNLENTLTSHGPVSRGICELSPDGFLTSIRERTKIQNVSNLVKYFSDNETWIEIAPDSVASMNFWGFQDSLFPALEEGFSRFLKDRDTELDHEEYFLPELLQELIMKEKATIKVLPTDEKWFGLTYQADLINARDRINHLLNEKVYPTPLWRS
jgi:NDP-sugar pyrophosphorylase family protein